MLPFLPPLPDTEADTVPTATAPRTHDERVAFEVARLRVQREARQHLDAETRGPLILPAAVDLRTHLRTAQPAVTFRVDGLQPEGSRVLLAAQFKAGKTTLVGNLVRTLVDGGDFLGHHRVTPVRGCVAILDAEMSEAQGLDWLRAQQIVNDDRVFPFFLRGRLATLALTDATARDTWATTLRRLQVSYVVLDCLRPVLDALGLNEHAETGIFLTAFDALLAEADVPEALVVHHMGHSGERARGDSRLRDWPDAEWRLVRQTDSPDSPRFFAAYGRDVHVPETQLAFATAGRRLTIAGGTRDDAAGMAVLPDVLAALADGPLSGRQIEAALEGHASRAVRTGLRLAIDAGHVVTTRGQRNATLHHLAPSSAAVQRSATPVRQRTGPTECGSATARIDALALTHSPEPFGFHPGGAFGDGTT
jgi:hypothetical protein